MNPFSNMYYNACLAVYKNTESVRGVDPEVYKKAWFVNDLSRDINDGIKDKVIAIECHTELKIHMAPKHNRSPCDLHSKQRKKCPKDCPRRPTNTKNFRDALKVQMELLEERRRRALDKGFSKMLQKFNEYILDPSNPCAKDSLKMEGITLELKL